MYKRMPRIFYKYRAFNERSLEMLKNNEIYFSNPLDFNDPFDCFAQELMHENFRNDLAQLLISNMPEWISREQKEQFIKNLYENSEFINSAHEIANEIENLKTLDVLSLSARKDSILMWSHYADSHQGFCIGFKNIPREFPKKVIYSKSINTHFLYDFFSSPNHSEDRLLEILTKEYFLTKYDAWKYEKEWRLIAPAGNLATYPIEWINSIIFGFKMLPENREEIKSIFIKKNIKYFEAIKVKNTFSIEIRSIL